jgi:hypothetical protein
VLQCNTSSLVLSWLGKGGCSDTCARPQGYLEPYTHYLEPYTEVFKMDMGSVEGTRTHASIDHHLGRVMSQVGWALGPHSCSSITDHICYEPETIPLLIFTPSNWNNGPFFGLSSSPHTGLIGCNYSSTKQISRLGLPWRPDQAAQQCESFAELHLY